MPKSSLLCELIRYGLAGDLPHFKQTARAISREEKAKRHTAIAAQIDDLLISAPRSGLLSSPASMANSYSGTPARSHSGSYNTSELALPNRSLSRSLTSSDREEYGHLFIEKNVTKSLEDLLLPPGVQTVCQDLIKEQKNSELLHSYGLAPRNKLLLIGPPGNGKTSLAQAMASALDLPLFVVRYESIIGSYLGETAARLVQLFEFARNHPCVLFFDEFETLGKERGDVHETGEIKRVVSSLLLQIDDLPDHVIAIAATNHDSLLDKAAWRRFQVRIELPGPTQENLEAYYSFFENMHHFSLGLSAKELAKKTAGISYAEAEELALTILRQYVLNLPDADAADIARRTLENWQEQVIFAHRTES